MISVSTGAFDQYGCPLIVFPVDGQDNISSQLSKAEVVDFINYFLCLHKYVGSKLLTVHMMVPERKMSWVEVLCLDRKKQEKDSLVSVVADLRHASPNTTRFIAETLLLLEVLFCLCGVWCCCGCRQRIYWSFWSLIPTTYRKWKISDVYVADQFREWSAYKAPF